MVLTNLENKKYHKVNEAYHKVSEKCLDQIHIRMMEVK